MEYVLPLSLLFITGIALTLTGDVSGKLAQFFTETTRGELNGTSVKVGALGESRFLSNLKSFPPPIAGEEQVCFTSGLCLSIPAFAEGTTAETAGGLGGDATGKYAYVLQQISDQLEADLGADDPFVLLVTQLANQGHALGQSEQSYIDFTSGHRAKYPNFKPEHINEVQNSMDERKNIIQEKISAYDTKWKKVQDYMNTNPDLLANYPEVENIINQQSQEIVDIGNGIRPAELVRVGNRFYTDDPSNPSEITHQDSNTVCVTGGDTNECYRRKSSDGDWKKSAP